MARVDDLRRFYAALDLLEQRLGGARTLARCTGRLEWPRRGVYFFREPGENRAQSGRGPRIVRVGTHALKTASSTRLWTRLAQHRGRSQTGHGNHRGSIFRLIVGAALNAQGRFDTPTWGVGASAPIDVTRGEIPLEVEVSKVLGRMPFIWLAIDDEPGPASLRGYIERNSIALLSNCGKTPMDEPSPEWLGRLSDRERVRESGLWNSNHVEEAYEPAFLDRFEALVQA